MTEVFIKCDDGVFDYKFRIEYPSQVEMLNCTKLDEVDSVKNYNMLIVFDGAEYAHKLEYLLRHEFGIKDIKAYFNELGWVLAIIQEHNDIHPMDCISIDGSSYNLIYYVFMKMLESCSDTEIKAYMMQYMNDNNIDMQDDSEMIL